MFDSFKKKKERMNATPEIAPATKKGKRRLTEIRAALTAGPNT